MDLRPLRRPLLALAGAALLSLAACGELPAAPTKTTVPTLVTTGPTAPSTVPETTPPETTTPETTVPETTAPAPTEPAEPAEPEILYEYRVLHHINPDLVGWMTIPGTVIDYPVVQSPYEDDFYLRKDFLKQKATHGTLYAREECDIFAPSDNITIYGHKMTNGTMFADLHKYKKKSFWEGNKYITFNTLYEYHTYEIFACFRSTADMSVGFPYHIFETANDPREFDVFVQTCRSLADYDTGIIPQYGEKLITLSTCDKSIPDGRYVVVARRVT